MPMDQCRRDAISQLAAANRADAHALRTQAVANLVRRAVCLELLEDDQLPVGDFTVTIACHFEVRESQACGGVPIPIGEQLTNLSARCKLVMHCADSADDDIVLVRGKGHIDNAEP